MSYFSVSVLHKLSLLLICFCFFSVLSRAVLAFRSLVNIYFLKTCSYLYANMWTKLTFEFCIYFFTLFSLPFVWCFFRSDSFLPFFLSFFRLFVCTFFVCSDYYLSFFLPSVRSFIRTTKVQTCRILISGEVKLHSLLLSMVIARNIS